MKPKQRLTVSHEIADPMHEFDNAIYLLRGCDDSLQVHGKYDCRCSTMRDRV